MKKLLFITGLLAVSHSGFAGCSSPVSWKMSIKNNGINPIKLCNNHIVYPGDPAYDLIGASGKECGGGAVSGASCVYTDQVTQQQGKLEIVYNSCGSFSTQASMISNNPNVAPTEFPFACPTTQAASSGTHITYDCGYQQKYAEYTVTAYFDLVPGKLYKFTWNDVVLTPVQGQAFADKLAKELALHGDFYSSGASFENKTILLNFVGKPESPYNGMACTDINS